MTPAVNLLKRLKIPYQIFEYKHDPSHQAYGREAAEFLASVHDIDPQHVFKTLIVQSSKDELVVAVIGVNRQLHLKSLAKELGVKKVKMADPHVVNISTGYVLGGVSPLGQKNKLKTIIDRPAALIDKICVSAGKRGVEIELNPQDLIKLTDARIADVST